MLRLCPCVLLLLGACQDSGSGEADREPGRSDHVDGGALPDASGGDAGREPVADGGRVVVTDGAADPADGNLADGTVDRDPADGGVSQCPHLVAGRRLGLHGMALFGNEEHFLAHIPVFGPPHNEQLIVQVTLFADDGTRLEQDFSSGPFSLRPGTAFSLDDLGLGSVGEFEGTVHQGNFEHGGPAVAEVVVRVNEVVVCRGLPLAGDPEREPLEPDQQEYFFIVADDGAYLLNRIRTSRAFQQVLGVDGYSDYTRLQPRVRTVQLLGDPGDTPRVETGIVNGDDGAQELPLHIGDELWCLVGPDFIRLCR